MATPDADRVADAILDLSRQASRIAYALECTVRMNVPEAVAFDVCATCGCRLVRASDATCPACGQEKKETTDG